MNQFLLEGKTEQLESYIESAHIPGTEYIVIPSVNGEALKSADSFKKIAEKMNGAAEILKKEGPRNNSKTKTGTGGIESLGVDKRFFTGTIIHYEELWYCCFDYGWQDDKGYWKIKHIPDAAILPKDYVMEQK